MYKKALILATAILLTSSSINAFNNPYATNTTQEQEDQYTKLITLFKETIDEDKEIDRNFLNTFPGKTIKQKKTTFLPC